MLLWRFGFQYTDNDQVFFWLGARNYSHGIFHEPCFYGQNYNYMLESFLAAPFFRLGIPCWYLLPVVTSVLALAPYLALAFYFLKRDLLAASVFVTIPILLPQEFGMLTTMPRGFVTGLCFLALFPLIERVKNQRSRFIAVGLAGGLAVIMNPNATPAAAALILVMQLRHPRWPGAWIYPLLGMIPSLAINYVVSIYYATHPPIHTLSAGMLIFQPGQWVGELKHANRYFAWLCPIFRTHGDFVLILLLAMVAVLARLRRWPETIALLVGVVILVAALGIPKVYDGDETLGYCFSRMFLAAPLLLGIGFSFCAGLIENQKPALLTLVFLCVAAVLMRTVTFNTTVQKEIAASLSPISLRRVDEVRQDCATIQAACRSNVDLLVALPPLHCSYADAPFYCVAGEMMFPKYPPTLIYGIDRRRWRVEAEMTAVTSNILFIGGGRRGWQVVAQNDRGIIDAGNGQLVLHRVKNTAGLPLDELLRKFKPVLQSD